MHPERDFFDYFLELKHPYVTYGLLQDALNRPTADLLALLIDQLGVKFEAEYALPESFPESQLERFVELLVDRPNEIDLGYLLDAEDAPPMTEADERRILFIETVMAQQTTPAALQLL